jgi:regulator of protease activity HflC (stomatin/prohibitin superfamily)
MLPFVFAIIFGLAAVGIALFAKDNKDDYRGYAAIPVVIAIVLLIVSCVRVVPAGHAGVPVVFGSVNLESKSEGLNFVAPWTGITSMSIRTQDYSMLSKEYEGVVKDADAIIGKSADGLNLTMDVTVWYKLDTSMASEVYQTIGEDYAQIILRPASRTAVRDAAKGFESMGAITTEREALQESIYDKLVTSVEGRGVIIEGVLLRDVKLPTSLETAIARKMEAEQEAERMQYVLQKEEQEAERKVIEAGGIADANVIISGSLTTAYLQWYWLEHMGDHNNVTYMIPQDATGLPLFNIPIGQAP